MLKSVTLSRGWLHTTRIHGLSNATDITKRTSGPNKLVFPWEADRKTFYLLAEKNCQGLKYRLVCFNSLPKLFKCSEVLISILTIWYTEFMTIGIYIFIGMVCFVVALTVGGLIFMCKTLCKCPNQCCCKDLEKKDINTDYGTYYYPDGERSSDVMEVTFLAAFSTYSGSHFVTLV